MAYTFNLSDGVSSVSVPTGNIKTTYSLGLIGRNTTDYGLTVAKNTVHHLENFAHSSPPSGTPLTGQLWYNSNEDTLRVYDGTTWKRATAIPVSSGNAHITGNLVAGTAYFNSTHDQLFVHDGSDFKSAVIPGGNVTSAYDTATGIGSRYGAKVETLYLTEQGSTTPKAVMAVKYVSDGTDNQGNADNNNETIMALFSDHDAFALSNTDPYYNQLRDADSFGNGTAPDLVGKGFTLRKDYTDSTVENANSATYASFADAVDISSSFTSNSTVIGGSDIFHWKRDLIPGQTETYDIGSNSAKYNDAFISNLQLGGASTGALTFTTSSVTIGTNSVPASHIYTDDLTVKGDLNVIGTNILGSSTDRVETAYIGVLDLTSGTIATTATNNTDIANKLFVDNAISIASADYVQLSGSGTQTITKATTFNPSGGTTFTSAINGSSGSFSSTLQGGTVTDGTLSINGGSITSGVAATFSGTVTATTFSGVATEAQYADLAEIYSADADYEPGTVVKIGGDAEITQTLSHADSEVFGVISSNPAYLMNKDAEGLPVALQGRVPVKVIGKVKKGERLVSSDVPGLAWGVADEEAPLQAVIGRALQNKDDGDEGVIEAVIGVK